ncbi:MAG TPA: glycosyltransferase [Geobacteraceae bacterium]
MSKKHTDGVSVVICCYNSSSRLPNTLKYLSEQAAKGVPWEVIVVDNASTDDTSGTAVNLWKTISSVPFTVVTEKQSGLSFARKRGLIEAQYTFVSFIDDDNWVCPEWVQLVYNTMSQNSKIGACGGLNEAICEIEPPFWFENFKESYAVGTQAERAGDITWTRGYLWGAGLTIRKRAMQDLLDSGFISLLSDRQGSSLISGGDSEICYALRLAGWRIWYEPGLTLKHYLPKDRLDWNYLTRLHRGFGASSVGLDPYCLINIQGERSLKKTWQWKALAIIKFLLINLDIVIHLANKRMEGNLAVLSVEWQIGRLYQLLKQRSTYSTRLDDVKKAVWVKPELTM